MLLFLGLGVTLSACAARAGAKEPFELRDGDRVVLIGGTFVEREQNYGYLETCLRTRWPGRNITFRNLGWSGDTVRCDARGYEKGAAEGLARLDRIVHDLQPTVLFIAYGMAESFEGEAGLASFRDGLVQLLKRFEDLKPQVVLIGPLRHEAMPGCPDPAEHNRALKMYSTAIEDVARERGYRFVDLFEHMGAARTTTKSPLTDNGIHLTAHGYGCAAAAIEQGLGLPERGWSIEIDGSQVRTATGVATCDAEATKAGMKIRIKPKQLPARSESGEESLTGSHARTLTIKGLPASDYALFLGNAVVARGSAKDWARGVRIVDDPAAHSAEAIRALVVEKDLQFFNQWRPANEPYIFGFRKQEQSRNQVELPHFGEIIEQLEQRMLELSQPKDLVYELKSQ